MLSSSWPSCSPQWWTPEHISIPCSVYCNPSCSCTSMSSVSKWCCSHTIMPPQNSKHLKSLMLSYQAQDLFMLWHWSLQSLTGFSLRGNWLCEELLLICQITWPSMKCQEHWWRRTTQNAGCGNNAAGTWHCILRNSHKCCVSEFISEWVQPGWVHWRKYEGILIFKEPPCIDILLHDLSTTYDWSSLYPVIQPLRIVSSAT